MASVNFTFIIIYLLKLHFFIFFSIVPSTRISLFLFITSFILLASFIKSLDVKALDKITEIFPSEAKLYGDSVYTDYLIENKCVELKTQRKKNSKRPDSEKQSRQKLKMRKHVEVAISDIKKMFPRTIHSVTLKGFLIKITMYILGLQLFKIINN